MEHRPEQPATSREGPASTSPSPDPDAGAGGPGTAGGGPAGGGDAQAGGPREGGPRQRARRPERRSRHYVGWRAADVLKAAAVVLALYLSLQLLWFAYPLVFTAFLGVLFGLAVSSGVDRLQALRMPRGLAAALIVFGILGMLGLVVAWSAPTLRQQSRELRTRLPQAIENVDRWLESHRNGLLGALIDGTPGTDEEPASDTAGAADSVGAGGRTPADTVTAGTARGAGDTRAAADTAPVGSGLAGAGRGGLPSPPAAGAATPAAERVRRAERSADSAGAPAGGADEPGRTGGLRQQLSSALARASAFLFSFVSSTLNALVGALLVMVITIYVAAEPDTYHRGLMHLFPHYSRQRAGEVLSTTAMTLRRWLRTQLIAMVVIGATTTIALLILGIPAAIPLGILAGVLEFIPTIGPILSAVPAVLMGFVISPEKALVVALVYLGIQMAENYLLIPRLMKEGMDLPPVLTITAQALMALIFGFIGLLVAVPLLAAVMVMVKMLYVEGVVGDEVDLPEDDD